MRIETERLIIREFLPADAPALHRILGDEETMRDCEPAYTPEKTAAFLQDFCIGKRGALAAVHKETDDLIGYILFRDQGNAVYEIGWFFRRDIWRRGYAFEACRALIDHAFRCMNVHRIFAETADPVRSVGLMKKLGMQPEGIQRKHAQLPCGKRADLHLYGLLKEDI